MVMKSGLMQIYDASSELVYVNGYYLAVSALVGA